MNKSKSKAEQFEYEIRDLLADPALLFGEIDLLESIRTLVTSADDPPIDEDELARVAASWPEDDNFELDAAIDRACAEIAARIQQLARIEQMRWLIKNEHLTLPEIEKLIPQPPLWRR